MAVAIADEQLSLLDAPPDAPSGDCPMCDGEGVRRDEPCPNCGGSGHAEIPF